MLAALAVLSPLSLIVSSVGMVLSFAGIKPAPACFVKGYVRGSQERRLEKDPRALVKFLNAGNGALFVDSLSLVSNGRMVTSWAALADTVLRDNAHQLALSSASDGLPGEFTASKPFARGRTVVLATFRPTDEFVQGQGWFTSLSDLLAQQGVAIRITYRMFGFLPRWMAQTETVFVVEP